MEGSPAEESDLMQGSAVTGEDFLFLCGDHVL